MYAIIEEGGKQYKVTTGDRLMIDRKVEKGQPLMLERVLLVGGEGEAKVGTPVVAGATVAVEVLGPAAGPKIDIQKYKRRKGYHKHIGHRQKYLRVKITGINV